MYACTELLSVLTNVYFLLVRIKKTLFVQPLVCESHIDACKTPNNIGVSQNVTLKHDRRQSSVNTTNFISKHGVQDD